TWIGEWQLGSGAASVLAPQESALPAARRMLALREPLAPASPTSATPTEALASLDPPRESVKAPTEMAPTTWVAGLHSPSVGTSPGDSARRSWPETTVLTDSLPDRLSSPSSDTAPSGSLA